MLRPFASVSVLFGLTLPAQAQTAEAIQAASKAGEQITMTGPLGAVFILVVLAATAVIVVLWRALREEQKAMLTMVQEVTKALSNSSSSLAAMSVAVDNTNRLNEERLKALTGMSTQIGELVQIADRNEQRLERIDRATDRPPRRGEQS